MDPVTVLGLVSSLITVVDSGWKAVKLFRDVQKHGTSSANVDRDNLAKLIRNNTAALSACIRDCGQPHSSEDRQFLKVSEDCMALGASLESEIQKLRNSKKPAWLLAVATAIKSREIGKIEAQLRQSSAIIDSVIVKRLGSQSILQLRHNEKLDANMRRVLEALSSGHRTVEELRLRMRDDVEKATESIIQHQRLTALEMTERIKVLNLETHDFIAHQHTTALVETARTARASAFIDSLHFQEIFAREQAIKEADDVSCSFIFTTSLVSGGTVDEAGESSFSKWLAQDEPVFWMTGKAGTGKSVVMKYAFRHEKTSERLLRWAAQSATAASSAQLSESSASVVVLRYFFWKPGSYLQRSILGLARSLLWQLLQQYPGPVDKALPQSQLPLQAAAYQVQNWAASQVAGFLQQALASLPGTVHTYIVIDALDECTDDKGEVQSFIHFLASCVRVKLCISSRPEEFPVRLSRTVSVSLADINRKAIRATAHSKLSPYFRLSYPDAPASQLEDIVKSITRGSEGVFLWAVLVIKEAEKGLEVGDSVEEIERMIRQDTPKDIADLFQQMIDKIHPRYMDEMSQYFSILSVYNQEWLRRPTLLNLFFINQDVWTRFESQNWQYFDSEAFVTKCARLQSRIETCAAGLVEISSYPIWPTMVVSTGYVEASLEGMDHPLLQFCRSVTFIHRSVGDMMFVGDGASFIRSLGPNWKQQSLLTSINCTLGFVGMLPIFTRCKAVESSPAMLLKWLHEMLLRLQGLGRMSTAVLGLLPRMYDICQSVADRLLSIGYEKCYVQFPNSWMLLSDFHLAALKDFGLPHFAAFLQASQYIEHWVRTASPKPGLLTEVLWYLVMGIDYDTRADIQDAILALLEAGADPNQPCRTVDLLMVNDGLPYIGLERPLSAWEMLISSKIRKLDWPGALANTFESFAAHNAQLNTTFLRTESKLLQTADVPTFITEASPFTVLSSSRGSPPDCATSAAQIEDSEATEKLAGELVEQDALQFLHIRAFKYADPSWIRLIDHDDGDNEDNKNNEDSVDDEDDQVENEPAQLDTSDRAGLIQSEPPSTPPRCHQARQLLKGKLFVFDRQESEAFMSLIRMHFPNFPRGLQFGSAMEDMLEATEFIGFFRGKTPTKGSFNRKVVLQSWFNLED